MGLFLYSSFYNSVPHQHLSKSVCLSGISALSHVSYPDILLHFQGSIVYVNGVVEAIMTAEMDLDRHDLSPQPPSAKIRHTSDPLGLPSSLLRQSELLSS